MSRVNTTCKQQISIKSYFTSTLSNFNIKHSQIGIIFRFKCYQWLNQVLHCKHWNVGVWIMLKGYQSFVIVWNCSSKFQKQSSRGVLTKRGSENVQQNYRKCYFNKEVALQLYWNCTSAWVSSCKLAAYSHNTFF